MVHPHDEIALMLEGSAIFASGLPLLKDYQPTIPSHVPKSNYKWNESQVGTRLPNVIGVCMVTAKLR